MAVFPTPPRLTPLHLTLHHHASNTTDFEVTIIVLIIHNKHQLFRIFFQTKLTKSTKPLKAYANNVAEFCLSLIQLLYLELKTIHGIFSKSVNNWIVQLVHRFNLNKAWLFEGSFFWGRVNLTPFIFQEELI